MIAGIVAIVQAAWMTDFSVFWALHITAQAFFIVLILLRPHREPASRIAWVAVVAAIPVVGVLGYLLLGETNIGRRNLKAMHNAVQLLPDV